MKKSRPQKESHRKPDGISREVYALTGGVAPLMPSIDVSQLKRRPLADEKVSWQWLPFTSSARKDDLKLYHWVRVVNDVPPTGDYSFAKYNKSVDILKYTDEEYENHLTDTSQISSYLDDMRRSVRPTSCNSFLGTGLDDKNLPMMLAAK